MAGLPVESCADCVYFDSVLGECHKYVPSATFAGTKQMTQELDIKTYWPQVESDDWCGEGVRDSE